MPRRPPFAASPLRKRMAKRKYRNARRVGYSASNLVGRTLNPIPQKTICKMKYADTVAVELTSAFNTYTFNLNSTFDPNRTGTGHQPFGRDTFATLYNRYRVLGCAYNVSVISSNTQLATQMVAIPANEDLTSSISNLSHAREFPRARYLLASPAAAGGPLRNLKGYVDIASLMGLTKQQYRSNENTQAQTTATPSELAILNLIIGSFAETTTVSTFYISIELTYTVEFFDPLNLAQS